MKSTLRVSTARNKGCVCGHTWPNESIVSLWVAEFATTQPHSSYAGFVFGLRHRWTYFLRTLPDIAPFLEPLERAIADLLVPAIAEHVTTQEERDLFEFPVRLGGLGLVNPGKLHHKSMTPLLR